jgi:hypothetical protein
MQNCVQDLFKIKFSNSTCYDTVSTYDTTTISLIINSSDTSSFCMHIMHDTGYDTPTMGSLIQIRPPCTASYQATSPSTEQVTALHLLVYRPHHLPPYHTVHTDTTYFPPNCHGRILPLLASPNSCMPPAITAPPSPPPAGRAALDRDRAAWTSFEPRCRPALRAPPRVPDAAVDPHRGT